MKNYSNPDAPCYANSQCSSNVQFQNSRHAYKVLVLIATYTKCFKHEATTAITLVALTATIRTKEWGFQKKKYLQFSALEFSHAATNGTNNLYLL